MTILDVYTNGASVRQTAKLLGIQPKRVFAAVRAAGLMRTKSEGKLLQYNPTALPRKGDELKIELSWVTIRSPYVVQQWFWGPR